MTKNASQYTFRTTTSPASKASQLNSFTTAGARNSATTTKRTLTPSQKTNPPNEPDGNTDNIRPNRDDVMPHAITAEGKATDAPP